MALKGNGEPMADSRGGNIDTGEATRSYDDGASEQSVDASIPDKGSESEARSSFRNDDDRSLENLELGVGKALPNSDTIHQHGTSVDEDGGGRSSKSSSSGSSSSSSDNDDKGDGDPEQNNDMFQEEKNETEDDDEMEPEQTEEGEEPYSSQREQKRRRKTQQADMVAAVEHIITIGNSLRHAHFREQEWKRQRRNPPKSLLQSLRQPRPETTNALNQSGDDSSKSGENSDLEEPQIPPLPPPPPQQQQQQQESQTQQSSLVSDISRWMHAEDVHVYGKGSGYAAEVWPPPLQYDKRRGPQRRRQKDDHLWQQYHGEGLHPLIFCGDVLSQKPLVDANDHADTNGGHVAPPTSGTFVASRETTERVDPARKKYLGSDTTVAQEDVPRALLLRCWQRAVDAASTTILQEQSCPRGPDHGDVFETINPMSSKNAKGDSDSQESKANEDDQQHKSTKVKTKKTALEYCQSLGIELPGRLSEEEPFLCPVCQLKFDAGSGEDAFREHFYGRGVLRGCCWTLIEAKQREIIGETLQREVTSQLDTLFEVVLPALRSREIVHKVNRARGCRHAMGKDGFTYGWVDVMDTLQDTLASSTDRMAYFKNKAGGDSPTGVTAGTVEFQEERLPIMLNTHIMEAISSRLIQRYAYVPK